MNDTGVYLILNTVNNKKYVGSTTLSFRVRWGNHKRMLRKDRHDNQHLQRAWNKYGEDKFKFSVLERCGADECLQREQFYLDTYQCFKHGYNRRPLASSPRGCKHSEATKEKFRKRMLGVPMKEEVKEKIRKALTGRKKTEQHKSNLWKNRRGWKHSDETKKKMSRSHALSDKKCGWPTGKKHTEATKKKISAAGKGVPKSPEHRMKLAEHLKSARARRRKKREEQPG